MPNQQLEREEVLKPCLKLCKRLKAQGYILKYRRLDALDAWHEDGSPDIEIWCIKDNIIHLLFAECKKPTGGIQSKSQIIFENKYGKYDNSFYGLVTNIDEIERVVKMYDNINFNPESFKEFQEENI